jgi:hypothetical protein
MVNRSRSTKQEKTRRTKVEIEALKDSIVSVLEEIKPATGQVISSERVTSNSKTEAQYKSTLIRLLTKMLRSGELPLEYLADNTRWMRKPRSYSSLEAWKRDVR